MRALLQWVAVIIFSSSLIGCGFHLRGNMALPPQYFHKMFIKTADPYGRLTKNLQEYLKKSSVELVTDQNDAPLTLQILSETKAQLLQSVSGTAQNRQYSLTYTVVFQLINQDSKILVAPQVIGQSRSLSIQANQILGGSNEMSMLYNQMRQAAVFDILNRLASQDIATMLQHKMTAKKL